MERGHPVRPRVARSLFQASLMREESGLRPLADRMSALRRVNSNLCRSMFIGGSNSSINLSQNNIQRPNDRHDVRDQMSDAHLFQCLKIDETRRTDAHAPGLLRAVGNQIATNLPLRSFD